MANETRAMKVIMNRFSQKRMFMLGVRCDFVRVIILII